MGLHSHLVHHSHQGCRAKLLHQESGDIVGTVGKAPAQGDGLAYPLLLVRASWGPGGTVEEHEGLRLVHHLVARGETFLHSQGVEERLHCGAYLALALAHVVIFEIAVVRTAHVCLHVSGHRLNCHETAPEYGLVVAYGIVRSHRGVSVTL